MGDFCPGTGWPEQNGQSSGSDPQARPHLAAGRAKEGDLPGQQADLERGEPAGVAVHLDSDRRLGGDAHMGSAGVNHAFAFQMFAYQGGGGDLHDVKDRPHGQQADIEQAVVRSGVNRHGKTRAIDVEVGHHSHRRARENVGLVHPHVDHGVAHGRQGFERGQDIAEEVDRSGALVGEFVDHVRVKSHAGHHQAGVPVGLHPVEVMHAMIGDGLHHAVAEVAGKGELQVLRDQVGGAHRDDKDFRQRDWKLRESFDDAADGAVPADDDGQVQRPRNIFVGQRRRVGGNRLGVQSRLGQPPEYAPQRACCPALPGRWVGKDRNGAWHVRRHANILAPRRRSRQVWCRPLLSSRTMQELPVSVSDPLQQAAQEESSGHRMLRAFRSRNYRLFFIGQGVSLIGTWLSNVAMSWLVFRIARQEGVLDAAILLGLVGFATQAPLFFLSPFTGVMVDRWPKRWIMVVTQALSMLQSATMAVLILTGTIRIVHVMFLAAFQGIVNAFDVPARQAFVVEMVEDRADLPNAIALNSTMFNSARLIGPAVAGVLIAAFGEGVCFSIDAVSYFAVLLGLLAMRFQAEPVKRQNKPVLRELKEGFTYSFGFAPTRALLLTVGAISFLGSSLAVLMPIFADTFSGHRDGAKYLGFLTAALGLGALSGGLYLATRRTVVGLGRVLKYTSMAYGVALLLFTRTTHVFPALLALAFCGFCFMVTLAATNTMLQTMVDDDKRGRLMSFFSMMVMGMSPLGALLAGFVASKTSATTTVFLAGLCCIGTGLWFATRLPGLRPLVRPIYVRKGIIKEISTAIQSAEVPGGEEK